MPSQPWDPTLADTPPDSLHGRLLALIQALASKDPPNDSPDGRLLEALIVAVESLEREVYPIEPPTPEEAAEFRAEQEGASGGLRGLYRRAQLWKRLAKRLRESALTSSRAARIQFDQARDWHQVADDRSAEIIRLRDELENELKNGRTAHEFEQHRKQYADLLGQNELLLRRLRDRNRVIALMSKGALRFHRQDQHPFPAAHAALDQALWQDDKNARAHAESQLRAAHRRQKELTRQRDHSWEQCYRLGQRLGVMRARERFWQDVAGEFDDARLRRWSRVRDRLVAAELELRDNARAISEWKREQECWFRSENSMRDAMYRLEKVSTKMGARLHVARALVRQYQPTPLVAHYKRLARLWMLAREKAGGALTDNQEQCWTSACERVWRAMSWPERDQVHEGTGEDLVAALTGARRAAAIWRGVAEKYLDQLEPLKTTIEDISRGSTHELVRYWLDKTLEVEKERDAAREASDSWMQRSGKAEAEVNRLYKERVMPAEARVKELEEERDRLVEDIGAINNDWHRETMRKLASESALASARKLFDRCTMVPLSLLDDIRAWLAAHPEPAPVSGESLPKPLPRDTTTERDESRPGQGKAPGVYELGMRIGEIYVTATQTELRVKRQGAEEDSRVPLDDLRGLLEPLGWSLAPSADVSPAEEARRAFNKLVVHQRDAAWRECEAWRAAFGPLGPQSPDEVEIFLQVADRVNGQIAGFEIAKLRKALAEMEGDRDAWRLTYQEQVVHDGRVIVALNLELEKTQKAIESLIDARAEET